MTTAHPRLEPLEDLILPTAYAISGGGKAGVPPGWYKVTVDIKKSGNPKDPYALPTPLVDRRYTDPKQTPLSKEVKADAPEGAYDLPVSK